MNGHSTTLRLHFSGKDSLVCFGVHAWASFVSVGVTRLCVPVSVSRVVWDLVGCVDLLVFGT